MKKIVCLLLALALCLFSVAFAESVPSKTTGDLTKFEVVAENIPEDANLVMRPVVEEDEEEYQKQKEVCQAEINALMESESVAEYFGEVKNAEGEVVDMAEILESETLNVYEFCPFVVEGYEEEYGVVTTKMLFSTPYEKDEKVLVLIGLVVEDEEENAEEAVAEVETADVEELIEEEAQNIEWFVYEGIGIEVEGAGEEEQGCIQVEFDPEIMLAIQEGTALMAIISK